MVSQTLPCKVTDAAELRGIIKFNHKNMSATKEFLLDLLHAADILLTTGKHIPPPGYLNRKIYEHICKKREKQNTHRILQQIKKQKLLTLKKRGDDVIIALTAKGKVAALKQCILSKQAKLSGNYFCLVSFDIPEHIQGSRWVFRAFLKRAGFKQIHKSVWYSSHDVIREISELVHIIKINDWVKIFLAEEIK